MKTHPVGSSPARAIKWFSGRPIGGYVSPGRHFLGDIAIQVGDRLVAQVNLQRCVDRENDDPRKNIYTYEDIPVTLCPELP